MSKLVVDQIQKSGGPSLSLPTVSAGAANSLMVGAPDGSLSFTTLGNLLPSGSANTVLKNDGAGNLSFGASPLNPASSTLVIGAVRSSSAQQNTYQYTWTSSGPWTTYQNFQVGSDANTTTQAWNMFLGDGYPSGTSQLMYTNNRDNQYQRELTFANNRRIGHTRDMQYYDNNITDNYTGITWMAIPVRNTSSASVSNTFSWACSSDWSSYGGSAAALYTPNSNLLSTTTGGTWTQLVSYQNSTNMNTGDFTVTVPANTTVILFLANTHQYNTTNRFVDTSMLYNLQNSFAGGLVCDLDMLNTLHIARSISNTHTTGTPHQLYTACATLFGDK